MLYLWEKVGRKEEVPLIKIKNKHPFIKRSLLANLLLPLNSVHLSWEKGGGCQIIKWKFQPFKHKSSVIPSRTGEMIAYVHIHRQLEFSFLKTCSWAALLKLLQMRSRCCQTKSNWNNLKLFCEELRRPKSKISKTANSTNTARKWQKQQGILRSVLCCGGGGMSCDHVVSYAVCLFWLFLTRAPNLLTACMQQWAFFPLPNAYKMHIKSFSNINIFLLVNIRALPYFVLPLQPVGCSGYNDQPLLHQAGSTGRLWAICTFDLIYVTGLLGQNGGKTML